MRARRLPRRPRPGRGRARRPRSSPRAPPPRSSWCPESLTGQFLSGARAIPVPAQRRRPTGAIEVIGATAAQPARSTCASRSGVLTCVTGVSGSGKSTLVNDDPLQGAREPPAPRAAAAGRAPRRPRARRARQGHRRRPVADRPHAALEPGDLHRPVRRHPRALLEDAPRRGRAATSRAASPSTSRAGAARPAAATARSGSRCTSCPTSTCRASSATGAATTARRSRSASRARRSPTCST